MNLKLNIKVIIMHSVLEKVEPLALEPSYVQGVLALYANFITANFITAIFQKIPLICLMRSTYTNFWLFYFVSAIFWGIFG